MTTSEHAHLPVMLDEVIEHLNIKKNGVYVDATFGRGGHAKAILKHLGADGRIVVIDKDPEAIAAAKKIHDERLLIHHGSFEDLENIVNQFDLHGKVDGILMDLGVSSPQLDDARRGFSFMREGPLDMRMDPTHGIDAATWVNSAEEDEIVRVLKEYGEERFAKRIAAAIISTRENKAITRTAELAEIVEKAVPFREKNKHPATRTFQAIRIYVNRELEGLVIALEHALNVLKIKGRLLVISFHSLEDRIVKTFMQKNEKGEVIPREIPVRGNDFKVRLRRLVRAMKASQKEINVNPRARSAVLRIAEKVS